MDTPEEAARTAVVSGRLVGSGYALTVDLFLTAAHVAGAVGASCNVRPFGLDDEAGTVVWSRNDKLIDAALVRRHVPLPRESVTPTRWADLRGHVPVNANAIGFPRAQLQPDGERRIESIACRIMPITGIERARFGVHIRSGAPRDLRTDNSGEPAAWWSGISGAPLLTADHQYLLGIIVSDNPDAFTSERIEALRVSTLLDDQAFRELVGAEPADVVLLTAPSSSSYILAESPASEADDRDGTSIRSGAVDDLLDEIDSVLGENAEEFVRGYVQQGGNGGGFGLELADELKELLSTDDAYRLFDFLERASELSPRIRQEIMRQRWGEKIASMVLRTVESIPNGVFHFLSNLAHFGYEWQQSGSSAGDELLDTALRAHEVIFRVDEMLQAADVDAARLILLDEIAIDPRLEQFVSEEFGFLLRVDRFASDHDTQLWIARARDSVSDRLSRTSEAQAVSTTLDGLFEDDSADEAVDGVAGGIRARSDATVTMEQRFQQLLSVLFRLDPAAREAIDITVRAIPAGDPLRLNVTVECWVARSPNVRCHLVLHELPSPVTVEDLTELIRFEEPIDHWVLFAPRSSTPRAVRQAVDAWNAEARYGCHIHVWTEDTGIDEFLAIDPVVLAAYHADDPEWVRPDPLTQAEREQVRLKWSGRLLQPSALDPTVQHYLDTPRLHLLRDEDVEAMEETLRHATPIQATDLAGTRPPRELASLLDNWLTTPGKRSLLVVGEFGDGKTFFTYMYSLRLAEQFGGEARAGAVPLRLALRDLRYVGGPEAMLAARLRDVGLTRESWEALCDAHPTMVFLDGFDELSNVMDSEALGHNIETLMACFRLFPRSAIVVTSRTWFFESGRDRELILPRIGFPDVLRLVKIDRNDVVQYLRATTTDPNVRAKVDILYRMHDPLGVAGKPLFLDMLRIMLPTMHAERVTELQLYEQYIAASLWRKIDALEENLLRVSRAEIVRALGTILERVAIALEETSAAYVDLRDVADEIDFARLLWDLTTSQRADAANDATQRVGARSLLRRGPTAHRDELPVDFFHRSVREFYVAKAIVSALDSSNPIDVERVLRRLALRPEIKWFVSQMISSRRTHERVAALESAARTICHDEPSRLGGNSLTLLAATLGRLPSMNYSGLRLDHADLSGADLAGVTFSGASLRYVVFDDANLEQADFTDVDFAGMRVEETSSVRAVSAQRDGAILAAYSDGTCKSWTIGHGPGRIGVRTLLTTDYGLANELHQLDNGDIAIATTNSIHILSSDSTTDEWHSHTTIRTREHLRITSLGPRALTAQLESSSGTQLIIAGLTRNGGVTHIETDAATVHSTADTNATYCVLRPGGVLFRSVDRVAEIAATDITALRVAEREGAVGLVTGHRDGTIRCWRLQPEPTALELVWESTAHGDAVTCLDANEDFVASGSEDRSVGILAMADGQVQHMLRRTVRCRGMIIDGVRGPAEHELLSRLLSRAPDEASTAVEPR